MTLFVFDNDGTLYDDTNTQSVFQEIFLKYCSQKLGVSEENSHIEILRLKSKWKTEFSVMALMYEFAISYHELVEQTYLKIDLSKCNIPTPDAVRSNALRKIKCPKVVFTNNPSVFARKVLKHVVLLDHFIDVIGMEETKFHGKPNKASFEAVQVRHPGFTRYVFCDDSVKNLDAATSFGWSTILFDPEGKHRAQNAHISISSFDELERL